MRIFLALALLLAACGAFTEATSTTTTTMSTIPTSVTVTTQPRGTSSTLTTSTTAPVPEAVVLDHPVIRLTLPDGIIAGWNILVAGGEHGWVVVAGSETDQGVPRDLGLWHTRNGTSWTQTRLSGLVSTEFVEITDLVYFSGQFFASLMGDATIVDPTILTSDDGVTWRVESLRVGSSVSLPGRYATPESPPWPGASAITDLEVHGGELVAVGWVQTGAGSSPAVWRTADGVTWTRSVLPNQVSPNEWANGVAVGDAGYLVTGLGPFHQPDYLWASTDGATWKPVELTKDLFFGHHPAVADAMWAMLTYDDGRQEMFRSGDGDRWTQVELPNVPTPQLPWGRELLATGDDWRLLATFDDQAGWMVSSAGDTFQYPMGNSQHFAEVFGLDVIVARSNDEVEIMPISSHTSARVVDVASDDVLNVRAGPGVEHDVVATLGFQALDIVVVDQLDNGWRFILGPTGQVGWVNGMFLQVLDGNEAP